MMNRVPVDQSVMTFEYVATVEVTDQHGAQTRNPEGLPFWKVQALVSVGDAKRQLVEVKVGADRAPAAQPMAVVSFPGLRATFWQNGDRAGLAFGADGMTGGASSNGARGKAAAEVSA